MNFLQYLESHYFAWLCLDKIQKKKMFLWCINPWEYCSAFVKCVINCCCNLVLKCLGQNSFKAKIKFFCTHEDGVFRIRLGFRAFGYEKQHTNSVMSNYKKNIFRHKNERIIQNIHVCYFKNVFRQKIPTSESVLKNCEN